MTSSNARHAMANKINVHPLTHIEEINSRNE
jgi:hypothetical protein